jgi:ribonuclease M5
MMGERLRIPYPVIVEGRYDKLRLESVIEAQILTTDGFGLFNHGEKTKLFAALAKKSPLIVLTDSDGAGKLIRSRITSCIPKERLIHLYVPRISGVEKRKKAPSAEGILGVEGMERELLYKLLLPYADERIAARLSDHPLSKTDFYVDGLTGGQDSASRRDAFAERLGLPAGMTPNALLAAVRMLCSYEEYLALVGRDAEKTE